MNRLLLASLALLLGAGTLHLAGCGRDGETPLESSLHAALQLGATAPQALAEDPEVPPPPFTEGIFPCSDCHEPDIPVNRERRELTMAHEEIELHHAEQDRWCLDCHDAEDRDVLRLANGEAVPFEESYRLCGQCHGDKYRDWKVGVHGRRVGSWSGAKQYLLCVSCHNAHSPRYEPIAPEPPPRRPETAR